MAKKAAMAKYASVTLLMRNYNGMNMLIKFQPRSQKYWYLKENKSPAKYICVVTIV